MRKSNFDDRKIYIDLLRILATLAVIVLHAASLKWYSLDVKSLEWNVLNILDSMVRWAVPVFVMMSGALFLDENRDISIQKLYTKNILRIITAFIFWSPVYALYNKIIFSKSFVDFLKDCIHGAYHMWFLFMIVGLYLMVPIFRKIVQDENITKYFLIMAGVFTFIIPTFREILTQIAPMAQGYMWYIYIQEFLAVYDLSHIYLVLGYSSYFVLGYYLSKKEFSTKQRWTIYALSVLGFMCTIILTMKFSQLAGTPQEGFYEYLTLNVCLESVGVFVLVKQLSTKFKEGMVDWAAQLSKYTFGIYMVHALILDILFKQVQITSVPVVFIIVLLISLLISVVLNYIPVVKKYIV